MADTLPLTAFDVHRESRSIIETPLEVDTLCSPLVGIREKSPLLCRL